MHIFYLPDIAGNEAWLGDDESQHAVRVLRLKAGDEIHLVDGKGGFYRASIADAGSGGCRVLIRERQTSYGKRNYRLHLAVAFPRNIQRFEWLLEKATEMGIDEVTPLVCERSEKASLREERLEKIVIAAMKQSGKAYKPEIGGVMALDDFIAGTFDPAVQKFIACLAEKKLLLREACRSESDAIILVGPEGDFSPGEITRARAAGFQTVSLGNSVMRTETAALAACHTLYLVNQ